MDPVSTASLVNIVGFGVGIALYSMLGVMVIRHAAIGRSAESGRLLFATAILGFAWNAGEFLLTIQKDIGHEPGNMLVVAASYSALGFLPSVVVHSAIGRQGKARWIAAIAYILSCCAASFHFAVLLSSGQTPSPFGLQLLTVGSVLLAILLLAFGRERVAKQKSQWLAALLIFAVSALHLSRPGDEGFWPVELVAHQSSLPLAIVILLQNYRFAFADLFLKRAFSLLLLSMLALGLYTFVGSPLIGLHAGHESSDPQAVGVILSLWIATALAFPWLNRFSVWLVDRMILSRPDYEVVHSKIAMEIDRAESILDVMNVLSETLGKTFTAGKHCWQETSDAGGDPESVDVNIERDSADVMIRTTEFPRFKVTLGDFEGGRRLLSDEVRLIESASILAARRIDELRVIHERCEQELREEEFAKLATEAQLSALRAQINPHFLFNALTTIGYLIRSSPEKAIETLLHLTKLLRAVLRSGTQFTSLDDELQLVSNYLDIERARFDERLNVEVQVADELRRMHIPSFILQPLVENAVKHAIANNSAGGTVRGRSPHLAGPVHFRSMRQALSGDE
ncbi:sensor histidine kinase [Leptolyngbya sp. 7M]|uniref:sensor histidine kinase n=1 Tax=Leptolyngbya sp. 7M TaxID=2812896 RepID=UPI001B8AC07E|nr:histidine kinase [Leptolyngbya sp. 7M]QYO65856.1 histidine kinase [Leptolyngbya sp. 7M]